MRPWNVTVLICAACVAGATACSDDDQSTGRGALTPSAGAAGASAAGSAGRGGSAGAAGPGSSAGSNAGGTGGSNAGGGGNAGLAGAAGSVGAGAAGEAGAAGAGEAPGEPDAGAPPPAEEPPAEEPPAEEPPPDEDVVTFSDVYGLLVTNCGGCHSGEPAYLPDFAQPDEAAASDSVQPGGLADRIYARTVTLRTMPPACRGGDFGDPGCVSEEEAALLQAWADGGYQR